MEAEKLLHLEALVSSDDDEFCKSHKAIARWITEFTHREGREQELRMTQEAMREESRAAKKPSRDNGSAYMESDSGEFDDTR